MFTCSSYSFKVTDFFPRYKKLLPGKKNKVYRLNKLVRLVEPIKGNAKFKVVFSPKFNYALDKTNVESCDGGVRAYSKDFELFCQTNIASELILDSSDVELKFSVYFILAEDIADYSVLRVKKLLSATKNYWKSWVSSLELPQAYRSTIIISALVLKLLTMSETGSIMAAATTSLPEEIGSVRNWDYRFCWVRDASYTVDALQKIGRGFESKRLMEFILDSSMQKKQHLQIMYGLHGEAELTEQVLGHLSGYKNSAPVRIGNGAYDQIQHDIYGNIIDVMYIYYVFQEVESKMSDRFWKFLVHLVDEITSKWDTPDSGIWEFRGEKHDFTYSKLMCFVGVDRAIKIAQHYGRVKHASKWAMVKDCIWHSISTESWNADVQAFTMWSGSDKLDASMLMLAYHEVLARDDPWLISTVEQIQKRLSIDGLVQRYDAEDDFGVSDSAFSICSFWLVDALHYIGRVDEAKKLFEHLLTFANHVGLFSEDIDRKNGELLGNFPQAYVHIAIINTAILLSEWSVKMKRLDWKSRKQIR